jgi:hypothetical protein
VSVVDFKIAVLNVFEIHSGFIMSRINGSVENVDQRIPSFRRAREAMTQI